MKRATLSIRIQLVSLLILSTISVPPWLMFKGNTIVSVCAMNAQPQAHWEGGPTEASKVGAGGPGPERVDHDASALPKKQEQTSFDPAPQFSLEGNIAASENTTDAAQTQLEHGQQNSPTRETDLENDNYTVPLFHPRRPLTHTYYARLSAPPGTAEAKAQHVTVVAALRALPGRVTIRHEFGMDEDDVLNVISFKLEGNKDGLEEIAKLQGVIGIYPVRTRKRPKALPLGPLKLTRPSLQSAHLLTGIAMVHQKLGLTGKGIKVGIVDTGIDYKHPALGGCFGPGCKVAFGYDFVGDDYDNGNPDKDTPRPDADPMDCAGHGTHVAGIVAARNEGPDAIGVQDFVGVAPDATLGAYRVFGCDGEVSDDVLLAALKAAFRDGMDVVNLSLGGSSGWPEEPFAIACSAYIEKGLHVAVANGNDGEQGLFEDGAPATAIGAIAVGSVDNTHFLGTAVDLAWMTMDRHGNFLASKQEAVGTGSAGGQGLVGRIGTAMASDASDVPVASFKSDIGYLIHVPAGDGLGCAPFDGAALLRDVQVPRSSIVVLLRRGGCTFTEKAKVVSKAKLGGMLVYDILPEQKPLGMAISDFNISAGGLSFEDATVVLDALKNKDANGARRLVARFSSIDQTLKLASGGKISDFSSWGPDARLKYKPDIVTPGGMIYSTFPVAKGGFATLQGTSMASPYMAGIQALYLAKYGKTDALTLLRILQSTATPTIRLGSSTGLTSVFQQGGGLVSMENLFSEELPTVVNPTALYLNDTQFENLDHDIIFYNPSASQVRLWTLMHRPAVSVNGFDDDGKHYTPVNQSRLRISELGSSNVIMSPSLLKLAPGATGTVHIHIDPPKDLNIEERWLYSGFLEFLCQTEGGIACGSSLVSYGGMHGHLAGVPILNPALSYPALQLDRYAESEPLEAEKKHGGKRSKEGKHPHKDVFRDRSDRVMVGKSDQDWVQILVSINFPTGLLTIEAESVCEGDHGAGNGGDKVRLEIGGSGQSRFQIETEESLEEEEQAVAQVGRLQQGDDIEQDRLVMVKERLARSQELAFMPGGLYMPYEGYSRVMLRPSAVDLTMGLHNKKGHQKGKKAGKTGKRIRQGRSKSAFGKKSEKKVNKKGDRKGQKKGYKKSHGRHGNHKHKDVPQQGQHGQGGVRKPIHEQKSTPDNRPCVPRILGLVPNGYNPWNTRSDSSENNAFQTFAWTGDLLLQNHDAIGGEDGERVNDRGGEDEVGADGLAEPGSEATAKIGGRGHKHHKKKKKAQKTEKNSELRDQSELSRDLPDGRYRLVVKVLKPWGVRGRASDVERWSSPVIIIKRKK